MFVKYAVNITKEPKAEVQMIDGRVRVAIDGWEGITAREVDHDDIVHAVRKGWIKLEDAQPTVEKAPEQPKPYKADAGLEKPGVTSTELGKPAAKKAKE